MANWLKDFMGRTPFAILGAIGLLSMASQFINLADDIENWLKVWKAVTRPIWEWIAGLVGFELPNWLKDYLTVGVIHTGMLIRSTTIFGKRDVNDLFPPEPENEDLLSKLKSGDPAIIAFISIYFVLALVFWPAVVVLRTQISLVLLVGAAMETADDQASIERREKYEKLAVVEKESLAVYFETLIIFLILVAIAGALTMTD